MISREEPLLLRPIRPSAALQDWYQRKLERLIREMAQSVLLHVRAAYQEADPIETFAADSADATSPLKRALRKWGTRWKSKFDDAAKELGGSFVDRAKADIERRMGRALKAVGFTVRFTATPGMRQALSATLAEQVNLIKSIPEQFLKDVQTHVWMSAMRGADMGTLTRTIEESYGVAHRRAALIARDQNMKAKAVMEETRRAELGITEAVWVHSGGGKDPRPEHERWGRDRLRYEIKRGMWSDEDGKYVWPGTPINCRCTSRAVLP